MARNIDFAKIRSWMRAQGKQQLYPELRKEMLRYKDCAIELKIQKLLTSDNETEIKQSYQWHFNRKKLYERYLSTLEDLKNDSSFQGNDILCKHIPPLIDLIRLHYDWIKPIADSMEQNWNKARKRLKHHGQKNDPYKMTILWSLVEYWLKRGFSLKDSKKEVSLLLHPKYGFPFSIKAVENNWRHYKKAHLL